MPDSAQERKTGISKPAGFILMQQGLVRVQVTHPVPRAGVGASQRRTESTGRLAMRACR